MCCWQVRGGSEGEDAVFALKEGARVPTEAELKKKLTPGTAEQCFAVTGSFFFLNLGLAPRVCFYKKLRAVM